MVTSKALWKVVVVGVALAGLGLVTTANAGMTFSLKLADNTTAASLEPGQAVTVQVWVNVSGSTASPEALNIAAGSILGTITPGFAGGMSAPVLVAPWNGAGSALPAIADLNGDGAMDLGTLSTSATSGFLAATAGGAYQAGSDFQIATFTYTVGANAANQSSVSLQFSPRIKSGSTAALRKTQYVTVDGTNVSYEGNDATNVHVGEPVVLSVVPEPATMTLLGLGGLGMLIRRRRAA